MTPTRTLFALACAVSALAGPATAAARGLETAFTNPTERAFGEADGPGAYAAARAAGATVIRIPVVWGSVAPTAPADARDPNDPAYNWTSVDDRARWVAEAGMKPLLSVYSAPQWAREKGPSPYTADFGTFAAALARRYDGGSPDRPRVRLFQLWNEPNLNDYLDEEGAPAKYRAMVRAAYPAIHAVHDDNVVVAGGLAPFAGPENRYGVGPLKFMRAMLREKVPFDVFSHHPYTSGGPSHRAFARDDASLGDLPELRRILRSTGHGRAKLWVTEFSWDSSPPDPFGVSLREHARWVSEGLYRMWSNGVSLVVWFQLRDNPRGTFSWGQTFQSGLFFRTTGPYEDEKAKPALRAFRFPFVALPAGRRVRLWGRTPDGDAARVVVERRRAGRWRRVTTLRADGTGIFRGHVARSASGPLRARAGGDRSQPFEPRTTRDRPVNPFGGKSLPPDD